MYLYIPKKSSTFVAKCENFNPYKIVKILSTLKTYKSYDND
jgi:hypothetical protein